MWKCGHWINGQYDVSHGEQWFSVHSPIDKEIVTRAASANPEDVTQAVSSAARAFDQWSASSPRERRDILLRAASLIEERHDEFAMRMVQETGTGEWWARFNCELGAEMVREAAILTGQIKGEVIPMNRPGLVSLAVRQPLGVCFGMAPWNAPLVLGCRAIAPALACGNSVVLKSSELCPASHVLLGEVFRDAGLPDGVLNILSASIEDSADIVNACVNERAIRHVNFTGSTRVGRIVAQVAAAALKPCLLELGSKAPVLVLEDANLEQAADAILFAGFANNGQICMSTERVIIRREVADSLIEILLQKIRRPARQGFSYADSKGAIISQTAQDHVLQLIQDAERKGANLLQDGRNSGYALGPTLIGRVNSNMSIYREESFGPVIALIEVVDDEEAISVANDTAYGLASAIFTSDIGRAIRLSGKVESGICHINSSTLFDEPQVPFGGVKDSGYGRFGGESAIREFTDLRWVTINCAQ